MVATVAVVVAVGRLVPIDDFVRRDSRLEARKLHLDVGVAGGGHFDCGIVALEYGEAARKREH